MRKKERPTVVNIVRNPAGAIVSAHVDGMRPQAVVYPTGYTFERYGIITDEQREALAACERVVEAAEAWADHDDDGGEPDQALWQAVCELRRARENP